MNKILLGAIGLGLFAAMKNQQPPTPTPPTPQPPKQPTLLQDNSQATAAMHTDTPAIEGTQEPSPRAIWHARLLSLVEKFGYNEKGLHAALTHLWQEWRNDKNFLLFPTLEALFLNLVGYQSAINENAIGAMIEWNSVPIYYTCTTWWNSAPSWSCTDWKVWHQKLVSHYGATRANQIWESAWNDGTRWGYCPMLCGSDCDFVGYFWQFGINVGYLGSHTVCNLGNAVYNVSNAVNNTAETFDRTAVVASYAVPALFVVGASWWTYNKFSKRGGKK